MFCRRIFFRSLADKSVVVVFAVAFWCDDFGFRFVDKFWETMLLNVTLGFTADRKTFWLGFFFGVFLAINWLLIPADLLRSFVRLSMTGLMCLMKNWQCCKSLAEWFLWQLQQTTGKLLLEFLGQAPGGWSLSHLTHRNLRWQPAAEWKNSWQFLHCRTEERFKTSTRIFTFKMPSMALKCWIVTEFGVVNRHKSDCIWWDRV